MTALRQREPRVGASLSTPKKSHPLYRIWVNIRRRCYKPTHPGYHRYGGRGLSVSERWQGPGGFEAFIFDMGPRPSPEHTIDRIDNDGNYEPGNCRWATPKEQASNRSTNRLVHLADGRILTLTQAAELCGKDRTTLARHLSKGRSIEYAMARHT